MSGRLSAFFEHFSGFLQVRKALPAQSLKAQHGHAVGKIQAARLGAYGYAHASVAVTLPQRLRQSGGLLTFS